MYTRNEYLKNIPSVDEILRTTEVQELLLRFSRVLVVKAIQLVLEEKRKMILSKTDESNFEKGRLSDVSAQLIEAKIAEITQPSLKRVINASGIIVHTNLGRAPLCEEAIASVVEVARYYSNLEFNLVKGERGNRYSHVEGLLKEITGAEAGFVVNNNAAAVLLCLNTLATGKEVIISRGELIEIGGSFRIPEIMSQSGAKLVEVGTTNRTHLRDYQEAINEQTAVILKAHTSNFRVVGFTAEVEVSDLNTLGREYDIAVMLDMGSGNLVKAASFGLRDEPIAQDAVKSGMDIVTFSGDKLLGGPQAGIILGKKKYIQALRRNPLSRALRIDKLTLAALEATLRTYVFKPEHIDDLPVMRMLMASESVLKKRARTLTRLLAKHNTDLAVAVVKDNSQVGGGAYPLDDVPTWAVAIDPSPMTVNDFEYLLRTCNPPIISRISKDKVLLDMRTVFPDEISLIAESISIVVT